MSAFTAAACPPMPLVDNASTNTTLAMLGTHVLYSCHQGTWFPDHTLTSVIVCMDTVLWSSHPENCQGMYELKMQDSSVYNT